MEARIRRELIAEVPPVNGGPQLPYSGGGDGGGGGYSKTILTLELLDTGPSASPVLCACCLSGPDDTSGLDFRPLSLLPVSRRCSTRGCLRGTLPSLVDPFTEIC